MSNSNDGVLKQLWQSFEAHSIAPDAPEGQRFYLKMAFYAGAAVTFNALRELGNPALTKDEADAGIAAFRKELIDHNAELQQMFNAPRGTNKH